MQVYGMQLFFVEDDATIRDVAVEYLQEHGYEVVEAATAEDAMQRLVGAPAPRLVVTDIDLGKGRSGIELADWLHARWPELDIIFASGRLDQMVGRTPHPHETCLAKPFRLGKLIEIVRSVVPPSVARQSSPAIRIASSRNAPEPRPDCLTRMLPWHHRGVQRQHALTLALDALSVLRYVTLSNGAGAGSTPAGGGPNTSSCALSRRQTLSRRCKVRSSPTG